MLGACSDGIAFFCVVSGSIVPRTVLAVAD